MSLVRANRIIHQVILQQRSCLIQHQFVRWKGHNKWGNIKATKGAKDEIFGRLSARYAMDISIAIKDHGSETDPERNKALARVIKEAQAQGLMKTTIENAIKNSKQATDIEAVHEVRGPGRVALMVELMGKNKGQIETTLYSILKKNSGVRESGIANMFEKKGVIVINNEKISLEELENDAIEFGAEDVEQFDEFFTLTCAPNDFSDVLCKLKEKYQIEHSRVEQVPQIYVENLSKRDKGFLKLLIQALESNPSVLAVYHNADF